MLTREEYKRMSGRGRGLQSWRSQVRNENWMNGWKAFQKLNPGLPMPRAFPPDLRRIPHQIGACEPELLQLLVLHYPRRIVAQHFGISERQTYRLIPSDWKRPTPKKGRSPERIGDVDLSHLVREGEHG